MIGLRYWSLANRGKLALTNDRVNSIKDTVEGDNSRSLEDNVSDWLHHHTLFGYR